MGHSVCVLMSTYNGERFLREQIDSILRQAGVEVRLVVRDDGSTDGTAAILDEYQQAGRLTWQQGENLGWAKSFMQLVYEAPAADYYALCDQDDIWLPDKLREAVGTLEGMADGCNLYCSNLYYYKDGRNQGPVYTQRPAPSIHSGLMMCITAGCTMVFNRNLQEMLKARRPGFVYAHDFWIYQAALCIGQVHYDSRASILYRQHENNQIGDRRTLREIWKQRWRQLKRIARQHDRERAAAELLRCFGDRMEAETRQTVSIVAQYRHNIRYKMQLLTDRRFTMGARANDLWLKLRILINRL